MPIAFEGLVLQAVQKYPLESADERSGIRNSLATRPVTTCGRNRRPADILLRSLVKHPTDMEDGVGLWMMVCALDSGMPSAGVLILFCLFPTLQQIGLQLLEYSGLGLDHFLLERGAVHLFALYYQSGGTPII